MCYTLHRLTSSSYQIIETEIKHSDVSQFHIRKESKEWEKKKWLMELEANPILYLILH